MTDGTMVFSVPKEDLDATGRVILEAGRWCKTFYADGPWRPRGKWTRKHNVHGVAYCSLCDYELHTNDANFCPNCGADMREVDA